MNPRRRYIFASFRKGHVNEETLTTGSLCEIKPLSTDCIPYRIIRIIRHIFTNSSPRKLSRLFNTKMTPSAASFSERGRVMR